MDREVSDAGLTDKKGSFIFLQYFLKAGKTKGHNGQGLKAKC